MLEIVSKTGLISLDSLWKQLQVNKHKMRLIVGFIICLIVELIIRGLFQSYVYLPSLILLFIIYVGLKSGEQAGVIWGLFAGFIRAISLGEPIALECMELLLVGYFSGVLSRRMSLTGAMSRAMFVFFLYVIGRLSSGVLYKIIYGGPIGISLFEGLLNALCSWPLFYLFDRFLYRRQRKIYLTSRRAY